MEAYRSALAVHRSRVVELLRAWDEDVETVDFRTFSRALSLLDLKVDPQLALALFEEFEPAEGSVPLDDLEYRLRVNAGLLEEGAAQAAPPIPPPLVSLDPASDEPMAEQLGRALGDSEPRSRLFALLRDWDVGGTGTIQAADFRQALASPNPSPYPDAGHLDPSPSPSPSPNPSPDQALTLLGVPMPPEEAEALFGACDAEGGGVLPCREQAGGSAFGQLALRRLLAAPWHVSCCPRLRPASANWPCGVRLVGHAGVNTCLSHWCIGALAHWCIGALVHWCIEAYLSTQES